MAATLFHAWRLSARRRSATRRILRLYHEVLQLVDQLAERAGCPADVRTFRTKVIRLRDARYIGEKASQRLNRLSTMARKAGTGELSTGELMSLVQSAVSVHRILVSTERQTRRLVSLDQLAEQLGVTAGWLELNWLAREIDPLPSYKWCDGLFINVDTYRDWRAAQPIESHTALCEVKGGAA